MFDPWSSVLSSYGGAVGVGQIASRRVGHMARVDRSRYQVKRDLLEGETAYVVITPTGDPLYWFSDPRDARAEAEELSKHSGSSVSAAA
jgi:hypothetical protein